MIANNLFQQIRIMAYSFVLLCLSTLTYANIRLPNNLGSDMVLQQQSEASLWGWANSSEKIYITTSWNNKTDSAIGDRNAKWNIKIQTPKAGGPYTITLKGENTIQLNNIMIGEVWVCSGQSNMEWSSYQNLPQLLEVMPHSANDNIRLFQVQKSTAACPQDNIEGSWKVCGPESLKGFSAIGYFFAKELQKKLNVPIGIINSSWGGTPAEVWTPTDALNKNEKLVKSAAMQTETPWWPILPGYAYNAMIHQLTKQAIAGVIWYQGESNVVMPYTYGELFSTMINGWRQAWGKELPFYYVQIAPYTYGSPNVGNLIREQQTKTLKLSNTGMVVITDLVSDVKNIHPINKIDVAKRLTAYALSETYKQNIGIYKSPMFTHMNISGNKASLYFDNAPNGFKLNTGNTATEFYIAGDDKVFLPAAIKLEKDKLIASNPKIKNPVAVRFSFSNDGMSNLASKEGLPVAPFRTDDWEVDINTKK